MITAYILTFVDETNYYKVRYEKDNSITEYSTNSTNDKSEEVMKTNHNHPDKVCEPPNGPLPSSDGTCITLLHSD